MFLSETKLLLFKSQLLGHRNTKDFLTEKAILFFLLKVLVISAQCCQMVYLHSKFGLKKKLIVAWRILEAYEVKWPNFTLSVASSHSGHLATLLCVSGHFNVASLCWQAKCIKKIQLYFQKNQDVIFFLLLLLSWIKINKSLFLNW